MNNELPFKGEVLISRDTSGWSAPDNVTPEALKIVMTTIDVFGHLINIDEKINAKEMAKRIMEYSSDDKAKELSNMLNELDMFTVVIFNGDHRRAEDILFKHSAVVTLHGDGDKMAEEIVKNQLKKPQYAGKEVRASVFVGQGGELMSGVFM
jgi:hypothetical protein